LAKRNIEDSTRKIVDDNSRFATFLVEFVDDIGGNVLASNTGKTRRLMVSDSATSL
jgi:hypothetical protein